MPLSSCCNRLSISVMCRPGCGVTSSRLFVTWEGNKIREATGPAPFPEIPLPGMRHLHQSAQDLHDRPFSGCFAPIIGGGLHGIGCWLHTARHGETGSFIFAIPGIPRLRTLLTLNNSPCFEKTDSLSVAGRRMFPDGRMCPLFPGYAEYRGIRRTKSGCGKSGFCSRPVAVCALAARSDHHGPGYHDQRPGLCKG